MQVGEASSWNNWWRQRGDQRHIDNWSSMDGQVEMGGKMLVLVNSSTMKKQRKLTLEMLNAERARIRVAVSVVPRCLAYLVLHRRLPGTVRSIGGGKELSAIHPIQLLLRELARQTGVPEETYARLIDYIPDRVEDDVTYARRIRAGSTTSWTESQLGLLGGPLARSFSGGRTVCCMRGAGVRCAILSPSGPGEVHDLSASTAGMREEVAR